MLWAAVAGDATTPGDVWIGRDRAPAPEVAARFRQAIELRAGGVPFAYAVGSTDFRTLQLSIDRRALIPRPETEGLVDLVLHAAGTRDAGCGMRGVAADIGTGCGCIALALAVEGNFERVIAVERSPEAAALARQNVARLHPAVPVEVRQGDLFAPLAGARYRAIVSNPPYLTGGTRVRATRGPGQRRRRAGRHACLAGRRGSAARAGRARRARDRRAAGRDSSLARALLWLVSRHGAR